MSQRPAAGRMRYDNSPHGDGSAREPGENEDGWLTLAIRSLAPVVFFALLLLGIVARLMASPEAGAAAPLAGIPVLVLVLCAASVCPRRS